MEINCRGVVDVKTTADKQTLAAMSENNIEKAVDKHKLYINGTWRSSGI